MDHQTLTHEPGTSGAHVLTRGGVPICARADQLTETQSVIYHPEGPSGPRYDASVRCVTESSAWVKVPALMSSGRGMPQFSRRTSLDVDTGDYLPETVTARLLRSDDSDAGAGDEQAAPAGADADTHSGDADADTGIDTDTDADGVGEAVRAASQDITRLNSTDAEGVRRHAQRLCREHGLEDVEVSFTSMRRAVGRAKCRKVLGEVTDLRLQLSRPWFVDMGMRRIAEADEELTGLLDDVIRHEIAHLLDYVDRGTSDHGSLWRERCRLTGADPERTCSLPDNLKRLMAPWQRECPACGRRSFYYSRPTADRACRDCCAEHNGGRYDDRFTMTIARNPDCEM